jgi:PHD/YefM family antitoxin component YafN of YafNO toxin-antitoxin module
MKTLRASQACQELRGLIDAVATSGEPVQIDGERTSAVLVSVGDWRALQESVHLMAISGMAASIRKGMATPLEECVEELDW